MSSRRAPRRRPSRLESGSSSSTMRGGASVRQGPPAGAARRIARGCSGCRGRAPTRARASTRGPVFRRRACHAVNATLACTRRGTVRGPGSRPRPARWALCPGRSDRMVEQRDGAFGGVRDRPRPGMVDLPQPLSPTTATTSPRRRRGRPSAGRGAPAVDLSETTNLDCRHVSFPGPTTGRAGPPPSTRPKPTSNRAPGAEGAHFAGELVGGEGGEVERTQDEGERELFKTSTKARGRRRPASHAAAGHAR